MGTNCAPLVADLFLFCYERDFMMSLSDDKQADVIDHMGQYQLLSVLAVRLSPLNIDHSRNLPVEI